jgi:hypothetical protein
LQGLALTVWTASVSFWTSSVVLTGSAKTLEIFCIHILLTYEKIKIKIVVKELRKGFITFWVLCFFVWIGLGANLANAFSKI